VRETLAEQRERLAHVGRLSTMGEMTASIAHEINQPLTAIAMYAQSSLKLLQREDPDLGKLAAALEKLNTQSLRAGAIIERIQRFARARESQRERSRLNNLLRDLVKLAEGDARLQDVTITFDLQDGLADVYCDPIQIQQVALNLIRNAIDAMKGIDCRHGNAITITSRALEGGMVEVAVSDQGPGVSDDQVMLLFKAFHTTKKDGMGMGLSICRTIIAEHGGVLSHRKNPGPGVTFFFTLPTGEGDHA
jgi:two-component system sensor kinase FixL